MKLGEFLKEIQGANLTSLEKTFGPLPREDEITPELVASLRKSRDELLEWCDQMGLRAHDEGKEKTRDYEIVVQALEQTQ